MNGDDVQQELEPAVIALGAVFYGILWVSDRVAGDLTMAQSSTDGRPQAGKRAPWRRLGGMVTRLIGWRGGIDALPGSRRGGYSIRAHRLPRRG